MNTTSKSRHLVCIFGVFLFLLWSERKVLINSTGCGNRVLQIAFTGCMLVSITSVICYLLIDLKSENRRQYCKGYLFLFILQTIAFLPMYTQNFMYGDDLWGFKTEFDGQIDSGIFFSRPFVSFLRGPLLHDDYTHLDNFRVYNAIILCIFACIVFKFLVDFSGKYLSAFCFAAISASSVIAVDCIAYASIFPINASLLFSAISFVIYLKARRAERHKRIVYIIGAGIALFSAFNMYQLGTPIVFLMYVITDKFGERKKDITRFLQAMYYLLFYGVTAIVYLGFTKGIQILTGIAAGQSARSQFITDIAEIRQKLLWFIKEVCPQSIHKIVAIIFGNSLFKENNMFYVCNYKSEFLKYFFGIILICLLIISIISLIYRQHNISTAIIIFAAIPLSFWPFLILPESCYLTYYAICIILFLTWLIGNGVEYIFNLLSNRMGEKKEKIESILAFLFVSFMVLQSNNYAENTWVNYCRDSYELLANTISSEMQNSTEIETIQVRGNMGPYVGGRDYVIFCVEDILSELGYTPDKYNIRQLDSEYFLTLFNDGEIEHMKDVLGNGKLERLLGFYYHDEMYSRWLFNGKQVDMDELLFLQQCFIETGQIIVEDEHTISIDLTGFNYRNAF